MPNQYLRPTIAIPSALEISAITNANPMVITATANDNQVNSYIVGQLIVLNVPYSFKMFQANGLYGTIKTISGNQITVNIDASGFDAFVDPNNGQIATLAPAGSRNLQFNNSTDSAPFQSYNNQGN